MRFIGNKELITVEIKELLEQKGLVGNHLILFDAFCGTGAVADYFKDLFRLAVNDMMKWSVIYTKGRIFSSSCTFEHLGFDPFVYLNENDSKIEGFFYRTYSTGGSERMYFTPENAARIDYFRNEIEKWKSDGLISENEYSFLLASLIESISFISNTAGVYGAYLKHWDPRAKKPLVLYKVDSNSALPLSVKFFNDKIENIIENVDCDILYLDPPYTQNQYGTQYHLLQTLVLNDNPSISAITGSRPTSEMRSDWSKDYKSHILFDKLVAKTKAKYIIFSYSTDGFLSKSFIEASLKRYGKPESYICKKISYNKYKNFKSRGKKEHFEYLFFVEKKQETDITYESPLNYIGSKAKMITQIKAFIPKDINTFIDAFGGGFNVGVNADTENIIYNELNHFVKDLVESFKVNDTYQYLLYIRKIIKKYSLEKQNSENYITVRNYYNSLPFEKRDPRLLYAIILYGFNQQIRFNGNHDFNNPVGMRWFNDKVLEKLISFSRVIKEKEIIFMNSDYEYILKCVNKNDFVYLDPPYRLTTGSYNDGKRGFNGWDVDEEKRLFKFADKLNDLKIRFMISYVYEHKNQINDELKSWVQSNNYKFIELPSIIGVQRKEILIINFEDNGQTSFHNKEQFSEGRIISRSTNPVYFS